MDEEDATSSRAFTTDSWRLLRIVSEFVNGFETMTFIGPSVSIFGSARLKPESPFYALAMEASRQIASKGFAIITGGGPGIMEAANKGAQSVAGASCGLSISLPTEDDSNAYIDRKYNLHFRYFFIRKVMFIRYAQAFVFFPGGFGTLDELFEALTLLQTKKIKPFPIYLMGKEYWCKMMDWLEETVHGHGCITIEDLKSLHITDDPEEVANGIERHHQRNRYQKNF